MHMHTIRTHMHTMHTRNVHTRVVLSVVPNVPPHMHVYALWMLTMCVCVYEYARVCVCTATLTRTRVWAPLCVIYAYYTRVCVCVHSNIDSNASVGTIFGIYKKQDSQEERKTSVQDLLRPGNQLVCRWV
jgi:hypothetical protein